MPAEHYRHLQAGQVRFQAPAEAGAPFTSRLCRGAVGSSDALYFGWPSH